MNIYFKYKDLEDGDQVTVRTDEEMSILVQQVQMLSHNLTVKLEGFFESLETRKSTKAYSIDETNNPLILNSSQTEKERKPQTGRYMNSNAISPPNHHDATKTDRGG
jgi:hypothetical protein